jgi:hypothetical protein
MMTRQRDLTGSLTVLLATLGYFVSTDIVAGRCHGG